MSKEFAQLEAKSLAALREIFGERLTANPSVRAQHGRGEAFHPARLPDAVAYAQNSEELSAAVRICARHRIPIIPFGAGTSLEGHVAAVHGGLCLDLTRLDRIIEVRAEDLLCRIEPGVTREGLNSFLRDAGLHFPIDPGANATLGGMAATRASGTTAVRYGTMRDNVLALEVITADGRVSRTGRQAPKSAAGYDLTHLFVGSEGTLGIISELTLRLHPVPEVTAAFSSAFGELRAAVDTVIQIIQLGIAVHRIELLDERQVRACNRYSQLTLPEKPTLFVEFQGTAGAVEESLAAYAAIARDNDVQYEQSASNAVSARILWFARHNALPAAKALRPGAEVWVTDVCVPISRLAECLIDTRADLDRSNLLGTMVGHVGDGNFHVFLLIDPASAAELHSAQSFSDRLVERALRLEGTCTGEHGIGLGKRKYLSQELGENAVSLMASIKHALDPQGIMNPGKLVDGRI